MNQIDNIETTSEDKETRKKSLSAEESMKRTIRTFAIRAWHFKKKKKKDYAELFPVYGIEYSEKLLNFEQVFGNKNPVVIEIGFGMGKATAIIAENNPDINYLGLEVHKPGIGKLLGEIRTRNLKNLRIIEHDAMEVLENMVEAGSVAAFHIFFPDPWQKKRHEKRRLIQRPRTDLIASTLKKDGYLYFVTDWLPYAQFGLEQLEKTPGLKNKFEGYAPHQPWRPETRFEQKGLDANRVINEMMFIKQ